MLAGRVVGALSLDYFFDPDRDLHRSMNYVALLGAMIAQAVAAHRRAEQDRQRLHDETSELRSKMQATHESVRLVGTSVPLGKVRAQVAQVAASNTTVLLRGESGTGKVSSRTPFTPTRLAPGARSSPSAAPRCRRISFEAELFGYEKGAFTGAPDLEKRPARNGGWRHAVPRRDRRASAKGQVKLLRVLQQREFERLGGTADGFRSTCACWPPPTGISKRRSPRVDSARISTTG